MKLPLAFGFVLTLAVLLPNSGLSQDANPLPEIEILERLDRNSDGLLAPDEIPPVMRTFRRSVIKAYGAAKAVAERTEIVDLALLESLMHQHLEHPTVPFRESVSAISNAKVLQYAQQLISLYDTDKNQTLDAIEFRKISEKWVECDLNQDFQLDVVEIAYGIKHALKFPRNPDGTFDDYHAETQHAMLMKISDQRRSEEKENAKAFDKNTAVDRSRQFATALVASFDHDQNGSLNSEELRSVGPSWLTVDFDKDGQATIDEIQVRFQWYQASLKRGGFSAENIKFEKSNATFSTHSVSESATPVDFAGHDFNGDGQVEMHEFCKEFNDVVVRDFLQRDANRDGVITTNEWNRFLAKRNREAAKASESKNVDLSRR